jgi:beta-glucanase (GH16 family)
MEIIGSEPSTINMSLHFSTKNKAGGMFQKSWTGPDFSQDWHVFAVDWEPNAITWYVDGQERARYTDAANIPNKPMYLLLNLAVGGSWPGAPDATTHFPADFRFDYVRVWKKG